MHATKQQTQMRLNWNCSCELHTDGKTACWLECNIMRFYVCAAHKRILLGLSVLRATQWNLGVFSIQPKPGKNMNHLCYLLLKVHLFFSAFFSYLFMFFLTLWQPGSGGAKIENYHRILWEYSSKTGKVHFRIVSKVTRNKSLKFFKFYEV